MIKSLAYIGFESPAMEQWRTFGPEVLGAQLADHPDAVALRFDERAARLMIHPGDVDRVAYIGWDCGDTAGMSDAISRLSAAGHAPADDPAAAKVRNVEQLVAFTDPFGFRHELTHGLADAGLFTPGREMDGRFITGAGGLGHIVLMLPDLDEGMRFYTNTLGFLESDHIETALSIRFLHCNPRHHTVALSAVPGMVGIHHLMLEAESLDDVGRSLDIVNNRAIPLAMTMGRHTNDLMTSFYVRTPSGFEIEYGTGGRLIEDDATWEVETYDAQSLWGHKPPSKPLRPGILRSLETA